ncbi:MAG: nucleotidyltransferase domain-containing protein [Candidatus Poribacteria bacterium]|nr:nucleotidyltransferase domain-containing protein [Candidatus Poribacteria bacterium]
MSSSVLKWPDAQTVDEAVRRWAEKVAQHRRDVLCIGYFGSYARGDWGVGSDLDLIIIIKHTDLPFHRRNISWDVSELPVPVDMLVYTQAEWEALGKQGRFYSTVMREAIWVLNHSFS